MLITAKSNTVATLKTGGHSIDISTTELKHALRLCTSWAPPPFAPGLYLMSRPLANKFDFSSTTNLPKIPAMAVWAAMISNRELLRPLSFPNQLYYHNSLSSTPVCTHAAIESTLEQWQLVRIIA